jgi:23S rRNA (guanosine2251-2'-O)-methyltransferase
MRVVYGMNPVRELLRSGAEGVSELWLAEGSDRPRAFAELERSAKDRGAKVRTAPRARLDRLAGVTQHQGIVAVVADYRYREVEDVLEAARKSGRPPLVVLLDGVEDPHNLGAVVRSAHALGAHGVILPRDRAAGVTPSAAKASAGAVEHVSIARVTNLVRCIEELK